MQIGRVAIHFSVFNCFEIHEVRKIEVLLQTKVANSNLMNLRSIIGHNAGIIGKKIGTLFTIGNLKA